MKLSTNEDVEAPIEAAFDMLCDFEGFERAAMRRGADVQRVDKLTKIGVGMTWQAVFEWRGKRREVEVELLRFDRPNELLFKTVADGLTGHLSMELIALSKSRTRMRVGLEIRPQSLSARLLVQSLKLAKSSLTKRFKVRVAGHAKTMEDRYAETA